MRKWEFPSVENIGIKGFNDIGEEFKDNPMFHLAKEICQNSLDTIVSSDYTGNKETIKVEFKEFFINPYKIPGNENGKLKEIFEEEYNFNKEYYKKDHTVPDFYKNAMELFYADKICCLRISDFNTTGLTGSDQTTHSPWIDLTKNAGVSDKDEGSAGSKGKGKFASFICSDFYTVFYSTIANDGLKASCGISRITGYKKSDNTITIGEGYYEDDNNPIRECLNLDDNFSRETCGTDIYIIGFKNNIENWKEKMIASIMDNFFVAIVKGQLEVSIGDDYYISQDTIKEYINNEKIKEYLLPDTECYYDIMVSSEGVMKKSYTMFEKDDLTLLLKKDKEDIGEINKVAAVRHTGMKILDLNHLPHLGLYHGILLMDGIKVNDYFRKLENATHSNWSADRVQNSVEAGRKIKELRNFVRETIKELMTGPIIDEISAIGVGETLPDEEEFINDDNEENKNESINDEKIKTVIINEKKPKKIDNKRTKQTDEEGEIDLVIDEDGKIKRPDPEPNPEPSPEPKPPEPNPMPPKELNYSEINKRLLASKLRLINNEKAYRLMFTLDEDRPIIKITFEIYGESGTEKTLLKKVRCHNNKIIGSNVQTETEDNFVVIKKIQKDILYTLDFEIDSEEKWTMEVKVYGIDK